MALKDLYETLRVPRKASAREIRRAYRDLARKYHPDFNPGDPLAVQKFREIQEAYEVLGNAQTRKAYDYYGLDFSDRVPARAPTRPAEPAPQPNARRASTTRPPDFTNVLRDFAADHRYRPAVGFPRLVSAAQIVYVTAPLVFVVGTLLYLTLPDAGVRELKRAQEALRHATSWKVESRLANAGSAPGDYLLEVSCPSSERTTRRIRAATLGSSQEFTLETVAIGNESYMRNSRANGWTRMDAAATGATTACADLQRLQDTPGLPPLQRWLSGSYVIEKERLRETPEGKCRDWKILGPGAVPYTEYVCLGVKDHLPRFQGAPGSPIELRFYDWNVPIEILPPPLVDSQ